MKIIDVKVDKEDGGYHAAVKVLEEGKHYTGTTGARSGLGAGLFPNPDTAVHAALSDAIKQRKEELHKSVSTKVVVEF